MERLPKHNCSRNNNLSIGKTKLPNGDIVSQKFQHRQMGNCHQVLGFPENALWKKVGSLIVPFLMLKGGISLNFFFYSFLIASDDKYCEALKIKYLNSMLFKLVFLVNSCNVSQKSKNSIFRDEQPFYPLVWV